MRAFDELKLGAAELAWNLPRWVGSAGSSLPDLREQLTEQGCCIVPGFLSEAQVDTLVADANRVYADHPEYVSVESNGSDQRIYGVDRICESFRLEGAIEPIDEFARGFYWPNSIERFQMLGKISYREGNLGSGSGWHRDSPFSHQFKALLYLSDVAADNGPFEYFPGSHRRSALKSASRFLSISSAQYRFTAEQIDALESSGILPKRMQITARRGTLLLVDSRGLHRGRPLQAGERFAVTRYYFPNKVPDGFIKLYPLTGRTPQRQ